MKYRTYAVGQGKARVGFLPVHHDTRADEVAFKIAVVDNTAAVLGVSFQPVPVTHLGYFPLLLFGELYVLVVQAVGDSEVSIPCAAVQTVQSEYLTELFLGGDTDTAHSRIYLDMNGYLYIIFQRQLGQLFCVIGIADGENVIFCKIIHDQRNIAVAEDQYISLDIPIGQPLSLPEIGDREMSYPAFVQRLCALNIPVTVSIRLNDSNNILAAGKLADLPHISL